MFRIEKLLPIVCLIAGLLLIGSEFLNTFEIEDPEGQVVALVEAGDRHSYSLALLGLLGILATVVAVSTGSRPAAIVVAVAGIAALAIFVVVDLPDAGSSDLIADPNQDFTEGRATTAGGFWISLIGATLMTISGILLATLSSAQLRSLHPSHKHRDPPDTRQERQA